MPRNVASTRKSTAIFSFADILPLCDFIAILLAAYASSIYCALTAASPVIAANYIVPSSLIHAWSDRGNMALIGASLATYLIYDQNFVAAARQNKTSALIFTYALRVCSGVALVALIGFATSLFERLPLDWLVSWLIASLAATALLRIFGARRARRDAPAPPESASARADTAQLPAGSTDGFEFL